MKHDRTQNKGNCITEIVRSVNWHITPRCNYNCRFCFAKGRGEEINDLDIVRGRLSYLKDKGLEKVTFAGGEPLLHPNIADYVGIAKELGFTTSIVTNGSLLKKSTLESIASNLDWIGISIDSSREEVERVLGRGSGHHVEFAKRAADLVHSFGIKLKINTVVTRLNYSEDMVSFIESLRPMRWKVFQCLVIGECNEDSCLDLGITCDEFSTFEELNRKVRLSGGARPVFERNMEMIDSYLMLSPSGHLTVLSEGRYKTINWDELATKPLSDFVNVGNYNARGGNYQWNK